MKFSLHCTSGLSSQYWHINSKQGLPFHLPAGGLLLKHQKEQKCLAVPVANRLTKPQKSKRKKLASKFYTMLLGLSGIKIRRPSSTSRRSNSFSFLTAFAPPLTGYQQGRPSASRILGFHPELPGSSSKFQLCEN
jgi:hypothetical protein